MATDPVEIINRRNAEVEKIRAYPDLTEEAKERRIAEVGERAQAEYAEAREAAEQEIRQRAQKAEKALFETPYPKHTDDVEKAQIRALRWGAYDGVYNSLYLLEPEQAREELDRLLTRAERTGDVELADAIYHVATERGERSVADAYLERRPNQKRRWEEFVAASQEAAQSRSIEGILGHALTERALSSGGFG
jgi:DNA-nicking Smr family endonuclease